VRGGHVYLRTTWSSVQLLDISVTGALLASGRPFPVGQNGYFRAVLGTTPVTARVRIVREDTAAAAPGGIRCGAAFIGLDESSRRSLEAFLGHRQAH
jgi:hypothetical protein